MSSGTNRAVAQVILVLVVVAGAAFLINSNVAGVQVYNVYPTISMLPTLEVGDLVVVHSVPYSSIHVGDVIVYEKPNPDGTCTSASEVIVHRVVNITAQGLITQGDDRRTNPNPDEGPPDYSWPPVPASCVKGVVVVALPYLGRVTEAFPPPYNYLLVAAILLVVFLIETGPWGGKKEKGAPDATAAKAGGRPSLWSLLPIAVSNLVILALIYGVLQDYAYRLSYWRSMGFTPTTTYSPFAFVTTAVKGSTYIGGQLTLDWTQVLLLILVAMDAAYLVGLLRHRRRAAPAPQTVSNLRAPS